MHMLSLLFYILLKVSRNGNLRLFLIILKNSFFVILNMKEMINDENTVGNDWTWRHRDAICRWFSNEASELYGVSARSLPKVQAFAEKYIPHAYESTDAMLEIRKLILCTLRY